MDGPRTVTMDELPLVEELIAGTVRIPDDMPPDLFYVFPRFFSPSNLARVKAIFQDGRPVSVCGYLPDRLILDGCAIMTAEISPPVTHPDFRHRGLSSLILDDFFGQMRREGVRFVHVVGDRGFYHGLGCFTAGIVWTARLAVGEMPPAGRAMLKMVEVAGFAMDLEGLYEKEDPRFARDADSVIRRAVAPPGEKQNSLIRIWLALREGKPIAYAVVSLDPGSRSEGRLIEYAGDRQSLAGSLRTISARLELECLIVRIPHYDKLMLDRLRAAGGTWRAQSMPGSYGLIDPVGLWDDLRPRHTHLIGETISRRLMMHPAEDGAVIFSLGQEAVSLHDRERLVQMVFGTVETTNGRNQLPPNLGRALAACFPLPMPVRGVV